MKFKPLISPTLSEMFVEELETLILSGELTIGEKLPTERELADRMKVSRAVINGGISELANAGFLEVIPRKGAYVADYLSAGRIEVLQVMLEHSGGKYDADMRSSLLRFRENIETDIAVLAAKNWTESGLHRMREQLRALRDTENAPVLGERVYDLYRYIALASGNMVYPLLLQSFRPICLPMFEMLYGDLAYDHRLDWFDDLIHAIEARDAKDAAARAADIIRWSEETLAGRDIIE